MVTKPTREGRNANRSGRARRQGASPFRKIEQLADEIGVCFQNLHSRSAFSRSSIAGLTRKACQLNRNHTEACLASVHILGSRPHTTLHPIFSVFLAELIADALDFTDRQHESLCNAALTANLGMYESHDQWASQEGPLDKQQRRVRDRHPLSSVERLTAAGIEDRDWLQIVLQHHEHADGSGYPDGLSGSEIRRDALILAVVDRYLAFVMPRLPRERAHPTTALKHIYEHTAAYDETIIAAFIKQLGIYPPGTSVRLFNGDIAIVTERRIGDSVHPVVVSVGNAQGKPYNEPIPRDTKQEKFNIRDLHIDNHSDGDGTYSNLISRYWSAQNND